ncbi:uncharacterized protein LOC144772324 isoform X1 [Lissotriton helveticus]
MDPDNTLLTFQDVVACFSQLERELLHKWQKTLYANVMKEVHQVVMSLGPVIATAVFSLRANEKDLCPLGSEDYDRRYSDDQSPSVTFPTLDGFTVSRDDSQCLKNPLSTDKRKSPELFNRDRQDCIGPHSIYSRESTDLPSTDRRESPGLLCTDGRENPGLPSTGDPVATSGISQSFPDYKKTVFQQEIQDERGRTGITAFTSLILPDTKKEAETCSMDHQESKMEDNSSNPICDPDAAYGISPSFPDEKTLFQQEMEDERGLTGIPDITCLILPDIKEEAEACSMGYRGSELNGSIDNHLGDPVATSGISQSFPDYKKTVFQQEIQDERGRTGITAFTSLILPDTKKEAETCSMDHQESKMEDNSSNPILSKPKTSEKEPQISSFKKYNRVCKTERHFTWTECEKSFNKKALLVAHERTHFEPIPYIMSESEKSFSEMLNRPKHRMLHTEVRPFHCIMCDKSFPQKDELLNHQKIHTGMRLYHCTECDKRFTRKHNLSEHQRIHTGEKPHHCAECGKRFANRSNLRMHQRIHTGEKPYTCTDCVKSFNHKNNLLIHQRTHTGERPFTCTDCEKSFTHKSNLRTHQRIHAGLKPHHCSMCEKSFTVKGNLIRHLTTHRKRPNDCTESEISFLKFQTF